MADEIFLLQDNDELVKLQTTDYPAEDILQQLLARYPDLLPLGGNDDGTSQALLLVAREAMIPNDALVERFALDHLFLDREGVPTLVEVKRASDTRARREVVAQMLDYASHFVVHWTVERIRAEFERTHKTVKDEPERVLAAFLEDVEPEHFWQQVKTNLQAGRIRMVFVADRIPSELRRIVEFLNSQMDPAEVLAVEIPQFSGSGFRTYVPRLIGQTVAAREKKNPASGPKRKWDESSFLLDLHERQGQEVVSITRRLLEWAQAQRMDVWWGEGGEYGSFVPRLILNGVKHFTFVGWSQGHIELYFQHMRNREPFGILENRRELLTRLNQLPGIRLPDEVLERRPSIPMAVLTSEQAMQQFLAVGDWYLDEIRNANG
jgi:hypothetical protein